MLAGAGSYSAGRSAPAFTSAGSSDLVSVLLERGAKLKKAMIKSTLDLPASQPDVTHLGDVFAPLKKSVRIFAYFDAFNS